MFKGIWGWDNKSMSYWWYIEYRGVVVHDGQRGISKKELESVKNDKQQVLWFQDIELDY